jgi:hypothetical protein
MHFCPGCGRELDWNQENAPGEPPVMPEFPKLLKFHIGQIVEYKLYNKKGKIIGFEFSPKINDFYYLVDLKLDSRNKVGLYLLAEQLKGVGECQKK